MAFTTPTDPNAAKVEAAELRAQAHDLLQQAEALDPTPEPKGKSKKSAKKTSAKKAPSKSAAKPTARKGKK